MAAFKLKQQSGVVVALQSLNIIWSFTGKICQLLSISLKFLKVYLIYKLALVLGSLLILIQETLLNKAILEGWLDMVLALTELLVRETINKCKRYDMVKHHGGISVECHETTTGITKYHWRFSAKLQ